MFRMYFFDIFLDPTHLVLQESMRALAYLKKSQTEQPASKKRVAGAPRYIQPIVANFKRTKAGGRLIVQELKKLLDGQMRMFPHKSFWNVDQSMVSFKDAKGEQSQIAADDLMLKAPHFFSLYFQSIRRKLDYGHRVQNWLANVA